MGQDTRPRAVGDKSRTKQSLDRERFRRAIRIGHALATPMTVLGFVWLVLLGGGPPGT